MKGNQIFVFVGIYKDLFRRFLSLMILPDCYLGCTLYFRFPHKLVPTFSFQQSFITTRRTAWCHRQFCRLLPTAKYLQSSPLLTTCFFVRKWLLLVAYAAGQEKCSSLDVLLRTETRTLHPAAAQTEQLERISAGTEFGKIKLNTWRN